LEWLKYRQQHDPQTQYEKIKKEKVFPEYATLPSSMLCKRHKKNRSYNNARKGYPRGIIRSETEV
jgi:hypothetical protein